jgi:hypothetical protein
MAKFKEHLRTSDGAAACGNSSPFRVVDFVDFSDGVRLGWACMLCLKHWKVEKAAREEMFANEPKVEE